MKARPDNLPQLQAAAAVGQAYLIRAYDEGLRPHGRHAAQLLLTHEDFDSRPRYLNVRNTLTALFDYNAVPVINENDTISVDEIKFGDNDRLAAMVTNLLRAPLLVILSVVDGLYRSDPGPNGEGEVVPLVSNLDEEVLGLAGDSRSALGTGGMRSKLQAAPARDSGRWLGRDRFWQEGRPAHAHPRRRTGRHLFLARGRPSAARKRWIGLTARPRGHLVVDAGAQARWNREKRAYSRSASSRSSASSKRRRGRRSRPRRKRIRPRPFELRDCRGPPDSRPSHRTRRKGASAPTITTRSSIRTILC